MHNFTVRPVLWKQDQDANGLCRLKICVTVKRKQSYLLTPYKLKDSQWDSISMKAIKVPNDKSINTYLRHQLSDIEKKVLQQLAMGRDVTSKFLKGGETDNFQAFAKEVRNDQKELKRILAFAGAGLSLSGVDVTFLRKYEAHERARLMSQNTINTTFKFLRRILRQAYAEKLVPENPFDQFDIPKYVQSERIYLVDEEKKALIALLDKKLKPSHYNTLCYFLFACYTGLRHSDWATFKPEKHLINGALGLRAQKNGKWVVLPIGPTLKGLIDRVKVLTPPASGQKCNQHLAILGPMAKISKPITTHTGRHSFATMCATNKIPRGITAELLGVHAKTVDVYYHITSEAISEQAAVLKTL